MYKRQIQDNDEPGKQYAHRMAATLQEIAASVHVLDLTQIWPELPTKGDISDLLDYMGDDAGILALLQLAQDAPKWKEAHDPLFSLFKSLEDFPEEEAKWLIPEWIPAGQISVIAADGGIGKTTLWCHNQTAPLRSLSPIAPARRGEAQKKTRQHSAAGPHWVCPPCKVPVSQGPGQDTTAHQLEDAPPLSRS